MVEVSLDELRALIAVLDEGNFVKASAVLGVPRGTLRRRVGALEEAVGRPLLHRGRNETTATEAGRILADGARGVLRDAGSLLTTARSAGDEPSGVLRVGLPTGVPPQAWALFLTGFRAAFPKVQLEARVFDDPRRRLLDEVDLAVHVGGDEIDGPWVTYELARVAEQLAASPAYLERRGTPDSLKDLAQHDLLNLFIPGADPGELPLLDGGTYRVTPIVSATDPRTLQELAVAGFGIALCAMLPIPGFETGLVPVLPDIVGGSRSLRMVVPRALIETPQLRAIFRFARVTLGRDMVESRPATGSS